MDDSLARPQTSLQAFGGRSQHGGGGAGGGLWSICTCMGCTFWKEAGGRNELLVTCFPLPQLL